jgi:hypothetical protein
MGGGMNLELKHGYWFSKNIVSLQTPINQNISLYNLVVSVEKRIYIDYAF